MARKKIEPEAIKALQALRPVCSECSETATLSLEGRNVCDLHYREHFSRLASGALVRAGLERKPGESLTAWRSRMFGWLRQNLSSVNKAR